MCLLKFDLVIFGRQCIRIHPATPLGNTGKDLCHRRRFHVWTLWWFQFGDFVFVLCANILLLLFHCHCFLNFRDTFTCTGILPTCNTTNLSWNQITIEVKSFSLLLRFVNVLSKNSAKMEAPLFTHRLILL